jgi:hypothetical protein
MPVQLLLESQQFYQVSTDLLMSVGDGVFDGVDREQISGLAARSFTHILDLLHQKDPKAAALIDGIQLDAEEMRAVLGTLKLMSDSRVQSVGLDVAKALSQRHTPTDRWSIVDRIHRQLMPRVGEIRLLREELLPLALRSWTPQHSWALTLARSNINAMQGLDEHWPQEIENNLAPVPAGGIIPVWNNDDAATDASNSVQSAEELIPDDVTTRNQKLAATSSAVSADKASAVAAGMLEVSRSLFDILDQGSWLSRSKNAALTASEGHGQHIANAGLTAMLDEPLQGGADSPVLCELPDVGSKTSEQALACRLKFGAQGLDALRAAPEIRVFRR